MLYKTALALLVAVVSATSRTPTHHHHDAQAVVADETFATDPISAEIRSHWMRAAIGALHDLVSPCPFEAYGAAVVNHTGNDAGELVCVGANAIIKEGNPTLHGEVAAINNCTAVLRDPNGPYKLSAAEVMEVWKMLSLYTTAEACPMCSAAIRWAGFKEYIYATSADTLLETGWDQLLPVSRELFGRNKGFRSSTVLYGDVLRNETDPLLGWQFQPEAPCPKGCSRNGATAHCLPN